jgi:acylphosphatase
MSAALHFLVRGKVQGVFFRASAKEVADQMGLNGWVRNTIEGDVEIFVSGPDVQLEKFIYWCQKGPSRAKVEDIKYLPSLNEEDIQGFRILR